MIVANELRSALSSLTDRLIAMTVVAIALVAMRSSLSHRPFVFVATAVAALAAVAGAGAARMIERRLDFHSQDGALAADALADGARRYYMLSIHALVCGAVTVCASIGRPMTAVLAPVGYLAGAGIHHIARRLAIESPTRRSSLLRPVRYHLRRSISGAGAAILVVLPLLLLGSMESIPLAVFIGLVSTVAALLLTMPDHGVVRFMSASGYRGRRIIGVHARPLLTFVIPTVAASLALSDRLVTIVILGTTLAALMLMTARILAYRVHSRRSADTLVSVCIGVVCLVGIAMPMLLPFVAVAILWHLHRRSVSATWLLT